MSARYFEQIFFSCLICELIFKLMFERKPVKGVTENTQIVNQGLETAVVLKTKFNKTSNSFAKI